mmetsp:Transcript_19978/g.47678  ORF Transcript_19978/g.47678 Transcript_19978/m.47678 type:complete len:249 (+) Transcript_19978:402-1148(+)
MNVGRSSTNVNRGCGLNCRRRFSSGNCQGCNQGIDAPSIVGREAIHHFENSRTDIGSVFTGTQDQIIQQLGSQLFHIVLIDQMINQLQRSLANTHIGILETVHHSGSMTLQGRHGIVRIGSSVDSHQTTVSFILFLFHNALSQGVQGHITNIVVTVQQETTQNVDRQYTQSIFAFHTHNGLDTLVQNGVAGVFGSFRIGGHLCQYIIHFFRCLLVVGSQQTQECQQLNLQKRIGNASHVVISRVSTSQ